MSAHDDYLDPDIHLWPPEPPDWWCDMENNCRDILKEFGAANWGDVYKSIYDDTDCGPSVGIICNEEEKPSYCEDLYRYNPDHPVVSIFVSSIVEGVERTTDTVVVDMKTPGALARLHEAVEKVDKEAKEIWNETHGCETCRSHFEIVEDEDCPVWDECPNCGGNGTVI